MSYGTWLFSLVPLAMIVIVFVDAALGARAEYLNATAILEGWVELFRAGAVRSRHSMFLGAEHLAGPARLAVGSGIWILEATAASALLALPLWAVTR